jgi:hypothetical protein
MLLGKSYYITSKMSTWCITLFWYPTQVTTPAKHRWRGVWGIGSDRRFPNRCIGGVSTLLGCYAKKGGGLLGFWLGVFGRKGIEKVLSIGSS